MDNKEQMLKDYGLRDNEIKVYLASLALGSSKVNEIAKEGNLLRTTTYEVLKLLVEKGLVSYVIKSGVKYFEVAEPSKLVNILEEKKKKIISILPELEALKKSVTEKPTIEMYEGKAGLKTILDDIIKSKPKEVLTLSSAKIFDILTFYFPNWIRRRVKARIYARILQEKAGITEELKQIDKSELREIRFLPNDFKINTYFQIYGNKVAILTLRREELVGVIIENKDITEAQKSLFEFLWNKSKP
jgi:sugar-specific transcriptional regulator TrmB